MLWLLVVFIGREDVKDVYEMSRILRDMGRELEFISVLVSCK